MLGIILAYLLAILVLSVLDTVPEGPPKVRCRARIQAQHDWGLVCSFQILFISKQACLYVHEKGLRSQHTTTEKRVPPPRTLIYGQCVSGECRSGCWAGWANEHQPLYFYCVGVLGQQTLSYPLWTTAKGLHKGCTEALLVGVGMVILARGLER